MDAQQNQEQRADKIKPSQRRDECKFLALMGQFKKLEDSERKKDQTRLSQEQAGNRLSVRPCLKTKIVEKNSKNVESTVKSKTQISVSRKLFKKPPPKPDIVQEMSLKSMSIMRSEMRKIFRKVDERLKFVKQMKQICEASSVNQLQQKRNEINKLNTLYSEIEAFQKLHESQLKDTFDTDAITRYKKDILIQVSLYQVEIKNHTTIASRRSIRNGLKFQMNCELIQKGQQSRNRNGIQNKAVPKEPVKKYHKPSLKSSSVSTRPSAVSPQVALDTLSHRHRATETIQSASKKRVSKKRSREEEHHEVDRAAASPIHSPPVKKSSEEQRIRSAEICTEGQENAYDSMQNMDISLKSNRPEELNSSNPEENSESLDFPISAAEQKQIEAASGNKSVGSVEFEVHDSNDSESGDDNAEYNESSDPDYPALSSDDILRESSLTPSIGVAPQQAQIEKVLRHMTPAETSPQPQEQVEKSNVDDVDVHGLISVRLVEAVGVFDETRKKELLTKLGLSDDKIDIVSNWLRTPMHSQAGASLPPTGIGNSKKTKRKVVYQLTAADVTKIKTVMLSGQCATVHECYQQLKKEKIGNCYDDSHFTLTAVRSVYNSLLNDPALKHIIHPNAYKLPPDQKKKLDKILRECGKNFQLGVDLMKQRHDIKDVSWNQVKSRWYDKTPKQTRIEILKAIEERQLLG